jgi:transposase, IS30 family
MTKGFSVADRERLVELICGGLSLRDAARAVGVSAPSALCWWRDAAVMELQLRKSKVGGLPGLVPPDLPGSGQQRRALCIADRSAIAAGCFHRQSLPAIAASIGRDKSVVSREISRHRSPDGVYRAAVAHRAAAVRRERPKEFKLILHPHLCRRIEGWMGYGWSPKLISQVLAAESDRETDRVSHETIYQALYVQSRGSLRADLHRQLSLKRRARKPRGTIDGRGKSLYREAFTISQRPPEVEDRAVPGHWEGDLIVGPQSQSAIGTLVERSTRFTILLHLPGRHDAETVAEAMIREMRELPAHLRRSITWDRGSELAQYAKIQVALDAQVFFCDPYSPWQRGTNENTNRLLRFWFEKGSDLSVHTPEDLNRVAAKLNRRPRPTLNLETPANRLNQLLQAA